ncbi:NACHT domain-containing NTPase [uncultured Psychroserpens sp.]|uniref:NACHT domain-containing protein n=1 Tax=uncultured Psychroserpens sp. TaxID=255436 RepID=UPI00261D9681|nr:NACHT domain-containing protein [uncultured Psychroserpens sp.]
MEEETKILVTDLVLPIIKDIVAPKIKSVIKNLTHRDVVQLDVEKKLDDYLTLRYQKFQIIDTLVFPNKQTLLDILYEPLTLSCNSYQNPNFEVKIDSYSDEFLPKFIRIIIEDTAGMGKSTLTKKLFTSIVREKKGFPILIELSQINSNNNILTEIQNQISGIGELLSKEFIHNLLSEGEFIFLFDGYDEISLENKETVVRDLKRFIDNNNDSLFLLTSRPDESLTAFGDFQKFNINPLEYEEAFSLLKRYDFYSHHKIAFSLIEDLKNATNETLIEYLNNPFLVSLLYKSYDFKKDIPIKKTQFYQQVYDALFENHDLSKEGYLKRKKFSNLHIDDFERVLRYLAYFTSIENIVEYDKNGIISYINKAKTHLSDLKFKSNDLLKDLITTVPIFRKDGNYYKWSHKSLQDYFGAKFIWIDAQENQKSILKKIFKDSKNIRFYNLLELYYDLDPKSFETSLLYWLLKEFEQFASSNYQNFETSKKNIKSRLENSFGREITISICNSPKYNRSDKPKNDKNVNSKFPEDIKYFNISPNADFIIETFINIDFKKETILEIISKKLPELVNHKAPSIDFQNLILEEEKTYKVNDKDKNSLNLESNFEKINNVIASGIFLDYDKAMKKLNELEKNMSSNINDDFLNW